MAKVAVVGHDFDKLGGYTPEKFNRLVDLGKASLQKLNASKVISGMSLGFPQAIASAAIELKIPLIAAVPFAQQDAGWRVVEQEYYEGLLFQTNEIVFVDRLPNYTVEESLTGESHPEKMFNGHKWMIDNCEQVLALFNGEHGGETSRCLGYVREKKKKEGVEIPILNAWNSWIKYGVN